MSRDPNFTSMYDLPGKTTWGGGHVYVLGFTNGTVKVGSTTDPAGRVDTHRTTANCFGIDIADCWVSRRFLDYKKAEKNLIKVAAGMATSSAAREWFMGVDFRALVAIAPEVTYSNRGAQAAHKKAQAVQRCLDRGDDPDRWYGVDELIRLTGWDDPREACPPGQDGMTAWQLEAAIEQRTVRARVPLSGDDVIAFGAHRVKKLELGGYLCQRAGTDTPIWHPDEEAAELQLAKWVHLDQPIRRGRGVGGGGAGDGRRPRERPALTRESARRLPPDERPTHHPHPITTEGHRPVTALTVPHIPRSVGEDSPARPPYSPTDLVGETYLGLWRAGVIPPGPMRDPQAAARACADLLRAFGVEPAEARSEVAA